MFRVFGSKFKFCVDDLHRFRAANTIIKTVYDHKGDTILTQKVQEELTKLKTSGSISEKIGDELIKWFNPIQGIQKIRLKKENFFEQGDRMKKAFNKKGNLPLHPTWVMASLLKLLYQTEINNQIEYFDMRVYGLKMLYIVGTPGLGKSITWISIKMLHDLRIHQLIKDGCPDDSIIKFHMKIFYCHADSSRQALIKQIRSQVQKDFGKQQLIDLNYSKEDIQSPGDWLRKVQYKYSQKSINVRFVVDQFNRLYGNSQVVDKANLWNSTTTASLKPIIIVSSKNNFVDREKDPLFMIGGSEQQMEKIEVDNILQTNLSRFIYTMDCLLFQLQKSGISREMSYKIFQNIKVAPIMTHLACSISVTKALYRTSPQQITQSLTYSIQNNEDYRKISVNLKDLVRSIWLSKSLNSQENKAKVQVAYELLVFLRRLSQFVQFVQYTDLEGKKIKKAVHIASMMVDYDFDERDKLKLEALATHMPNFLLYVDRDQRYLQDSKYIPDKFRGKIVCFLSAKKIKQVRHSFFAELQIEDIKLIKEKLDDTQYAIFCIQNKGAIFQSSFKSAMKNRINDKLRTIVISFDQRQAMRISFEQTSDWEHNLNPKKGNQSDSTWEKRQITKLKNSIISSKGICFSMSKQSMACDILVSQNEKGHLKLLFIDATAGTSIAQKIENLKSLYFINGNLKTVLDECANDVSIKSIEVKLCVLKGALADEPSPESYYQPQFSQIQWKDKSQNQSNLNLKTKSIGCFYAIFGKNFQIKGPFGSNTSQYKRILGIMSEIKYFPSSELKDQ